MLAWSAKLKYLWVIMWPPPLGGEPLTMDCMRASLSLAHALAGFSLPPVPSGPNLERAVLISL